MEIEPKTILGKSLPIFCVATIGVGGISREQLLSEIKELGGLDELAERVITDESFDIPAEPRVVSVASFEVRWFGENRFLEDAFLRAWSREHLHEGYVCRTLTFEEPAFVAKSGVDNLSCAHVWCGITPRRTVIDFPQTATIFRLAGYNCSRPRLLEAHPRKHYPSGAERILLAVDRIVA
jgi:hypothetical protein